MKTRIITSALGIPVVFIIMAFYKTVFFNLLVAVVCLIGVHEACKAFFDKNVKWIFGGLLPISFLMLIAEALQLTHIILPVAFLTLLYFTMLMIKKLQEIDFARLCGAVVLSAVVVCGFYAMVHLKTLLPVDVYGYDGVLMILLSLAFAWGSDAFAYFCGRAWGKHKLAPVVSPNKTIEGFIGGFFGSVFFGFVVCVAYSYIIPFVTGQAFVAMRAQSYIILVVMALVSCPLGVAGDLFASAIKRQCKIKDYGTIFPGHGGILDRFDSVLFITPFVAMLTAFCVNSLGTVFF